jgi:hypothetical protein
MDVKRIFLNPKKKKLKLNKNQKKNLEEEIYIKPLQGYLILQKPLS